MEATPSDKAKMPNCNDATAKKGSNPGGSSAPVTANQAAVITKEVKKPTREAMAIKNEDQGRIWAVLAALGAFVFLKKGWLPRHPLRDGFAEKVSKIAAVLNQTKLL